VSRIPGQLTAAIAKYQILFRGINNFLKRVGKHTERNRYIDIEK
jgi:hypothetical protein